MDEPATLLCDIIQEEMELENSRVKQYNQEYSAPTDDGLYIVISRGPTKIISLGIDFDYDNDTEIKSVTQAERYDIEITSKDETANTRLHEVYMSLISSYSRLQQEINQVRIQRNGDAIDLSVVDGGSSLFRYRLPVTIFNVIHKETSISMIDKFPSVEDEVEGP